MSVLLLRRCLPAFAVLALVAVAGCDAGGIGKTVPVKGTVTLNGEKLTSGMVTYTPDAGSTSKTPASGPIGPDGTYTLQTGTSTSTKAGAVPGKYKVTVNTKMPPTGMDAGTPVDINPDYSDVAKTPFIREVTDAPAAGAYDLALTK